jgi:hypothetical protein
MIEIIALSAADSVNKDEDKPFTGFALDNFAVNVWNAVRVIILANTGSTFIFSVSEDVTKPATAPKHVANNNATSGFIPYKTRAPYKQPPTATLASHVKSVTLSTFVDKYTFNPTKANAKDNENMFKALSITSIYLISVKSKIYFHV